MGTMVRLAAVQPRWRAEDYASAERFADRVLDLASRAIAGAPGPALVAFPELWALPLLTTAGGVSDRLDDGLWAAARALFRQRGVRWTALALRRRWRWSDAAYADLALGAYAMWTDAFARAARATGATLVAGSGFFPTVAFEAARGLHVVDPRVHNLALLFAPSGAVVARSPKLFLTQGLERRVGLARGRLEDLPVVDTPVGRVAVAVCLDGWYHHVIERFDGLGAQVLVQPSANAASWARPWPPDPAIDEGQAWLGRGLRAGLVGRAHLRYGVNPMLVGSLPPLVLEGRSTVVVRRQRPVPAPDGGAWKAEHGVLGIAAGPTDEDVVAVDVPHPDEVA
ncbi:MAG: nitrilase-related carbon-nitrogen hydrolase [Trueperaceae bacterium]